MENSFDKNCDSYSLIDNLLSFLILNNTNQIKNEQKLTCTSHGLSVNYELISLIRFFSEISVA